MGAIAEALVAFARPLIDETDGSEKQVNNAFRISQLCFNLALLPSELRDDELNTWRQSLEMDDEEFDNFRNSVVLPMIRRHEEMFPQMHQPRRLDPPQRSLSRTRTEASPKVDRYAPCPCNSGRKYKFCCGKKGR